MSFSPLRTIRFWRCLQPLRARSRSCTPLLKLHKAVIRLDLQTAVASNEEEAISKVSHSSSRRRHLLLTKMLPVSTSCLNLLLNPVNRPGRELPRGYFCAVTPP